MQEVMIFSTLLAPIILALVQLVKTTVNVPNNVIPAIALGLGLLVGFAAVPFTDLDLTMRLWAGALAGLASTGTFELFATRQGTSKGDE